MIYPRFFVWFFCLFISIFFIEQQVHAKTSSSSKSSPENSNQESVYLPWNSFFNMMNVIELENVNNIETNIKVEVFDQAGEQLGNAWHVPLSPYSKFDVLLGNITEHENNSYGTIKLSWENEDQLVNAKLVQYRTEGDGKIAGLNSINASSGFSGKSYLPVNTINPSLGISNNPDAFVSNWLTLVNLENNDEINFTLIYRDRYGSEILTRNISLATGKRLDVEGGHETLGADTIGSIEIIPQNDSKKYIAHLSRYGVFLDGDKIRTVMNLPATTKENLEKKQVQYLVSDQGSLKRYVSGSSTFLEIFNPESFEKTITLSIIEPKNGLQKFPRKITIPPMSVIHLDLDLLARSQIIAIESEPEESAVIAFAMTYYFDHTSGESIKNLHLPENQLANFLQQGKRDLVSVYALPPTDTYKEKFTAINTFLGQENFLRLFNLTNETNKIEISIFYPESIIGTISRVYEVDPLSNFHINIKDITNELLNDAPGLKEEHYATVRVRNADPSADLPFLVQSSKIRLGRQYSIKFQPNVDFALSDNGLGRN